MVLPDIHKFKTIPGSWGEGGGEGCEFSAINRSQTITKEERQIMKVAMSLGGKKCTGYPRVNM